MSTVRAVAGLMLTVVRVGLPYRPRNYEHTRRPRHSFQSVGAGTFLGVLDQEVVSAVSSMTKLVVPPLVSVSVPVNFSVTVCPAYADRSAVRWV